jgi:hypothetical protein
LNPKKAYLIWNLELNSFPPEGNQCTAGASDTLTVAGKRGKIEYPLEVWAVSQFPPAADRI